MQPQHKLNKPTPAYDSNFKKNYVYIIITNNELSYIPCNNLYNDINGF